MLNKYFKTVSIVATRSLGDRQYVGLVGDGLLRLLRVALLLALWRSVLAGKGVVSGMSLEAVMTYTLVAEVFARQLSDRSSIDGALWDGSIAQRFLRPMGLYGQFAAEMVGEWVPGLLLFSVPLVLLAPLLGVDPLPVSWTAGLWFGLSLVLGIVVGLALDVLFAAGMVFLDHSVYALQQIRDAVSVLLSGAIVPLALLPWGLGEWLAWLPFASLASAPLRIYTGTGDPLFLVPVQLGWCLVLWVAAHGLWRYNRERLVSHGG